MVQAQPLQFSLGDQPANQAMRLFEDCRLLHADTRQLIDVEEAAVIYLVGCNSPKGEPIVLLLEEVVQRHEAVRLTGPTAESLGRGVQRIGDDRLGSREIS